MKLMSEKYSFEDAKNEAYKIKDKALELKSERNEDGEPSSSDYAQSELTLQKEREGQEKIDNEKLEKVRQALLAENEASDGDDVILNKSKETILYNNLELGNNPKELINKARELIVRQDTNGEKVKIFNEALHYYSNQQEEIGEVPIYHGTGSHSLYKIIESGEIDSSKNIFGGEKIITGKSHGGNSFAIGGYDQSEIFSHLYARMNEKEPNLLIDSKSIFGDEIASGKEVLDVIYRELPKLKPEERSFIEKELRGISSEDVIKLFDNEKYYFDYDATYSEWQEIKEKLEGKRGEITDKRYRSEIEEKLPELESLVRGYNESSDREKEMLRSTYGIVLVCEGNGLPREDLENFTTGGICERRTKKPIEISKIKQIRAPYNKISQIKEWVDEKIKKLPEDSEERKSLENVKIIPLEYFEVKSTIKKMQQKFINQI